MRALAQAPRLVFTASNQKSWSRIRQEVGIFEQCFAGVIDRIENMQAIDNRWRMRGLVLWLDRLQRAFGIEQDVNVAVHVTHFMDASSQLKSCH
ncbi:hypothetical protein H663_005240 [Limnohabitans planktonicus II-D5]|uniref:Uncharacterized protein n=1 Tax=Limnohabitans planktonicus II-D5 TaxID=1293045 RepID=A0A2T7UGT0_9BURK|nr:hypothetical protein H663_005240 [Limnohabitans planktonicus II-D5]